MKSRIALCLFVPFALLATSCGDDDDSSADTTEPVAEEPAAEEPAAEEPAAASGEEALVANVPEVAGGTQAGQEMIQEGGIHYWGTVDGAPADIVATYSDALTTNGWTIEGSGGDPSGELGAGVQATYEDGRYVSLNVGGPGDGVAFGDLCVWPATPSDNNCQNDDQQQDDGDSDDGDGGPPEEVTGFIPDEVEQFIP